MNFSKNRVAKEKAFYHFMLLYFLFCTTLNMFSQKVYKEKDGIIMMEAENTFSPLDLWVHSSYYTGYSSNGHIEFTGGVVTGAGAPLSPLVYKFKVTNSGDYALNIRGRSRLLQDEQPDWGNDAWFKVTGDYDVGANGPPTISWMNTFTKIFVGRGGNGNWGWGTNYDKNHTQPKAIFKFKAGEIYTLTMAGRSKRFNVDRILLAKTNIPAFQARAITQESEWFDDGVVIARYSYDAIHHFATINAGEVAYYKDEVRDALAIDASVLADRDKFAKATTVFTGKDGVYNILLKTLAEFDGECTYKVLINDNLVGTYKNLRVDESNDYKEQQIVFEGIEIKENDLVSVRSNSQTNGLIPEGTGTAWARGRWTNITMIPTTYQGRVAVVADGNYRDSDDIAGTPVSLAILSALGLEEKLVHYSHSCDLIPGTNDPGGAFREEEMQISCDGTAAKFGGFDHLTFFNCQSQKVAAITDLKNQINASSLTNPLWIIEAGEPDIIWEAVNAAEQDKRKFIYMVTHHPANDRGDTYNLSDVMALGIPSANLKSIPDQNALLKKPLSDWYWARDHSDSRINWLWDRGFLAQTSTMNYPAIVGKFDCSDAGMLYYWATIKSGGDFSCNVPKLKQLFLEYIPVIPPDAGFKTPVNGVVLETGANIEVETTLAIAVSEIKKMELFINDVSVSVLEEAPFSWGFSNQLNTQLENMSAGTYTLKLKTTNNSLKISTAIITIEVKAPVFHEPYSGIPHKIPGIIELEDYDKGGEGIAFYDTTVGNSGNAYRIADGENVDISIGGSGFFLSALSNTEYTRYTVQVKEEGAYQMLLNYKTFSAKSKPVALYVLAKENLTSATLLFSAPNGSETAGIKKITNSTGTAIFGDYRSPNFNLKKGDWVLELRIPSGGAGPSYDYMRIVEAGSLGFNEQLNRKEQLNIYPIPNSAGKFNINKKQEWAVFSISGKKLANGSGDFVDISRFAKGIYILKTKKGFQKRLVYN